MRIVILANVPVWTLPGLEDLRHHRHYATWLEPLIPAFQEELGDIDMHWITFSKEAKHSIEQVSYGQTFHILPRGSHALSMISGYASETLQIRKLVKKLKPDLVHAWGSEEGYGIAGALSGVPKKLFTLQGSLTDYVKRMGGTLLFRLQAFYEMPTVRAYRHGTAESPGAAKILAGLNPNMEINTVDYGVNAEFFHATWNPADRPTVLFVGGVNERKGIADLVWVASQPVHQDTNFHILGDGPLRHELSHIATPNVKWLGQCYRDRVVAELQTAWALAIPTLADTGPTVVKEARVVGLPIITTTAAGASCYVEDKGCGFVIEPTNRLELSKSIAQICHSREECLEIGRRGWTEHRETLDPKTTAKKFINIYKRMLNA
jgi:glycosyltransferase involved in cell wall biosynthesis